MSEQSVLLARVTRSGRVESEHYGQLAIVHADGQVERAFGDIEIATYLRSSSKPFQAIACLDSGAADQFRWTDEDVAVVCSSHSAEPMHLEQIRSLWKRAGLVEDDLKLGPHAPNNEDARDELIRSSKSPTKIHNNCSGKHTGMLSACVVKGWPKDNYLERDHPVQQANLRNVGQLLDMDGANIPTGIDGCGVPSFYLPVSKIAQLFAQLATDAKRTPDLHPHVARVSLAMRSHPQLLSGTGHLSDRLGKKLGMRVVGKSGAEGVFGLGIPELGLGLAVKFSDGSPRAVPAVLCRVLRDYLPDAPWDEIEPAINPPILNTRDAKVGTIEAAI